MKYILINWSYNEPGKWISICSTDLEAAKEVSQTFCGSLRSYRHVKYNRFSKDGGKATIEDIVPDEHAHDVDAYLADFFMKNGWKADRFARNSYIKTT